MDYNNKIAVDGWVQITDDETGEILLDEHNTMVCSGLQFMAGYLSGGTMTAMTYLGVGSGSTAATTADTALGGQIGSRQSATVSAPAFNSVRLTYTFGAGVSTGNWYEAGIFNAATAGTMLCRVTYGLLTKGSGDSFTLQYTVTFYSA